MIISLQSDLGRPIFKLTPISMCSLKSMGKNLQNELWARPVASKLSEWRPPTLFLGADTENGKKTGSFRILANYSYAIVSYIEFGNTQFKSISMHWAGLQCDIYRF